MRTRKKKSAVRKKTKVDLGAQKVNLASPLLPPLDEQLVQLGHDVVTGKAPSWTTTVLLAELAVHHPPTLAGARAALRSNPEYRDHLAARIKDMVEDQPTLDVYRDQSGRLVLFDDYDAYVAAEEAGLTTVNVHILGEAAPTTPNHAP